MADTASKTLLVTNLPNYVKYEEFERLFTQLQGCASCQLAKSNNGQLFGVLEFLDVESAALAKSIYNGFQGWGLPGLYIHSPPLTFPNKRPLDAGPEAGPSKQARTSGPNTGTLGFYGAQEAVGGGSGNQAFGQLSGDYGTEATYLSPTADGSGQFAGDLQYQDVGDQGYNAGFDVPALDAQGLQNGFYGGEEAVGGQVLSTPVTPDQPAPNPTLYITGLPPDITQRELAHVFRPFLGFLSVRLLRPQGSKQAGVATFDSADNSSHACTTLAGYPMDLEDRDNYLLNLNFARPQQPRNREGGGGRMSGPSFPGRSPRGGGARGSGGSSRGGPSRGGPSSGRSHGGRSERGLLGHGPGPGPMPMGARGVPRSAGAPRGSRGPVRIARHAGARGEGRSARGSGPDGPQRGRGRGPPSRGHPAGRGGGGRRGSGRHGPGREDW